MNSYPISIHQHGYNAPFVSIRCLDDSGYVVDLGMASSILKIVDENHLEAFKTIPSSSNRDIFDIYIDDTGKFIHQMI